MTADLSSSLNKATLPRWPLMVRKSLTMPHKICGSRLSLTSSMRRLTNWRTSACTSSNKWPDKKKPRATFSSLRRCLTPQGVTATMSGSRVLEPSACESALSNKPPWWALACTLAAKSKARSMLATKLARFRSRSSNAPALIKASTLRLFTRVRSMRTQKSNKLVNSPPAWRAATMASMACWPVPRTAPKP